MSTTQGRSTIVRPHIRRPLALLVLLLLVAAACGRDNDTTTDTTGAAGNPNAGNPPAVPGFDGTTIKLGVVTPTSGAVAIIGNPLTAGNKAWFDALNEEKGGIAGKYKVSLEIVDSKYDPPTGVQAYNQIKGDVVMFAQLLGTPIVKAVLDQMKADNIVAQPASLDADWVREQNLLPLGGPYQIQAINAVSWYTDEGGGEGKKWCSMIQDDAYGEAGQAGLDFAYDKLGIEPGPTVRFGATDADFTAQIGQLQSAGCEVVFLVSTPSVTGKALGTAAQTGFAPQWIGQSPSWIGALAASPVAPYLQSNYMVVAEGTEYGDSSVPGMAELVRIKDKYAPDQPPDYYFNFGYLEGVAVTQLLEKAVELGDVSHQGIIDAMNAIDLFSYDGLSGDYKWGSPEDRVPPRESSIFKVNPAKPYGLQKVIVNYKSDAAEEFEFE